MLLNVLFVSCLVSLVAAIPQPAPEVFTVTRKVKVLTDVAPFIVTSTTVFTFTPSSAPAVSRLETMMIYTDGACASNGLASPRGGFAFVFNITPGGKELHVHTSNRAELRAVVAALAFRAWSGEGWRRVVVVTDSEYVGKGATTWMRTWSRNGWRTSADRPVANRDLWEALSVCLGDLAGQGCEVSFWMVPRHWNTLADAAAKAATEMENDKYFTTIYGAMI
ncbi:RNase H domain protein [Mycena venus]|uniref:ribonuclease H n=1 Tax=Mycena venus TaxID=2733690 RepID=A0A8H6YJX6_9AGAR|nr:RNase H domain protein [Mycena venus]